MEEVVLIQQGRLLKACPQEKRMPLFGNSTIQSSQLDLLLARPTRACH
jgi:hypothetical protein